MKQREWSEIAQDPKVVTGCLMFFGILFLGIALGYYLGWGMTFVVLGVFFFWLGYSALMNMK